MKIETFVGTAELARVARVTQRSVELGVASGAITPDAELRLASRTVALFSPARAAKIANLLTSTKTRKH